MTTVDDQPKSFREICNNVEILLGELKDIANVLEVCLDGNIDRAPENGRVSISGKEAAAIHWTAFELITRVRRAWDEFNDDYEPALKGQSDVA